jgi:flagellar biogenesis protein FliO
MLLRLAQTVDETSGAYAFGRMLGFALIIAAVIWLVLRLSNRNK